MEVSIPVFEDCISFPSIASMELLRKTGSLLNHSEGERDPGSFFDVRLVSGNGSPVGSANAYPVHCHASLDEVERTDLVIVPALDGFVPDQLERNRDFIPWIERMHGKGADVASICTGAFLLAETGLLDGRTATTHWMAHDLFRSMYPRVTLLPQQIIVDHGQICTSGGATSFLNLIIYLVEKYCGVDTARLAAKMFLIDIYKSSQGAYAILSTQKNHADQDILKAQKLIEEQTSRPVTVGSLSEQIGISRRNFVRRFKNATGNTPMEYIHRVKVETAKRLLESSQRSFSEIVNHLGYEDVGSFRRVFMRSTGITPSEYRKKYNWQTAPAELAS